MTIRWNNPFCKNAVITQLRTLACWRSSASYEVTATWAGDPHPTCLGQEHQTGLWWSVVDQKWKMQNAKSNWRQSSSSIIIHGNFPDKWCNTFYLSRPSLPSGFSTPGGLSVPRCVLTRAYTYLFGIAIFIKGALECTFFRQNRRVSEQRLTPTPHLLLPK